ncbi:MAG: CBS domain-containing protein [Chromatiales bacterium]|jgi:CBS domain-containing protein
MTESIRLADMKVKDIRHLLVEDPATTSPTASLLEVLEEMKKDLRTRHVYVVDESGRLLGTVRMGSVVEFLFPFDAVIEHNTPLYESYVPRLGAQTAADLMHAPGVRVTEETSLGDMARLLIREAINELPVVDENERLIGQVSVYETIKAYLDLQGLSRKEIEL